MKNQLPNIFISSTLMHFLQFYLYWCLNESLALFFSKKKSLLLLFMFFFTSFCFFCRFVLKYSLCYIHKHRHIYFPTFLVYGKNISICCPPPLKPAAFHNVTIIYRCCAMNAVKPNSTPTFDNKYFFFSIFFSHYKIL